MRILGLDYGSRRIGCAISDSAAEFAFPAGAIPRKGVARDIQVIQEWIQRDNIELIVLGLPLHMSGQEGTGGRAVRDFSEKLKARCQIPVHLFDERLTTVEASRALSEMGISKKQQKDKVDSIAATILLRAFIESPEFQCLKNPNKK